MALFAASTSALMYIVNLLIESAQALEAGDPAEQTKQYAWIILPALIGIALATGFSDFFQRILANALSLNTVAKMQKQMLSSVHGGDLALFSRETTGSLISKFTFDVKVVSDALIRVLSNLIKDLLTVIFTIGGMLYLNWQLTGVLAIFLLALVPIIELSKRIRGSATDVQAHTGKLTAELKQSFTGARMVKTYGLEAHENQRLGTEFDTRIRLFLKLVTQHAWIEPIMTLLGGLVLAGVFIFGFWQAANGTGTPGSVVAVLTGVMILAPRLRALGTLNNVAQEGLAALDRIFAVIDETPTVVDAPGAAPLNDPRGAVTFDNVGFLYPDGTEALKGMSFAAKPGETIALVGASGGGKSTVINLIPRLYDVSSGSVSIDGTDIRDVTLESLRANMALVSQHVTLFDDTIAANIGFGDSTATRDDIIAAAKAADAHDFISRLPKGYDSRVGEDGDTLSGGQRQRIAIARAILRDAPILLLDEATSALDAESESKVQAALETLSKGRTTIVIAHRLSTVQNADKIFVLDKGAVVESGTHKTLSKKKDGVYAKLRDLQVG